MELVLLLLLGFPFLTVAFVPPCTTERRGDRYVDLSYSFKKSSIIGWGEEKTFEMDVVQNGTTEFGIWSQSEEYASGTHTGTHMDAPCHGAKGGWRVTDIPLDRLFAPAAVVDITQKVSVDRDALMQVQDLRDWEHQTGRSLDHTIVLMRTGWSSRWPDREAYTGNAHNDIDNLHFPGVSGEAARWLVKHRKIYGLGVESLSLDGGRNIALRNLPAHKALLGANIYGLENVPDLKPLPPYGAMLYVLPMKIEEACGGPVRIVARIPARYY